MKRIRWIIAYVALLSGCAHYQPYTGAPAGASQAEREQLYRDFSFTQDERGLLYAQGEAISSGNTGPHSAENYAKKSAPDIDYPKKSKLLLGGRDAAWLGALSASLLWWSQDAASASAGYTSAYFSILSWVLDWVGRGEHAGLQDAQAFNEALASDLGLAPQPPLDSYPIMRANDADRGWRFGLTGRLERVSALDMQAYFTTPTWTPPWRFQDYWSGRQLISAGYGWAGGWHLTAELGPLADRYYGVAWSNGDQANHEQRVEALNARLGKAYTWMISPHHQASLSPELTIGWASLDGTYRYQDINNNELGSYSYSGNAPLVGAGLRFAVPLSRRTAFTLELGYEEIVFSNNKVTDSRGSFPVQSDPTLNWRGQPTLWDYSGPVIRFGTELF